MHVDGPDGRYELPAKYLVGADGGASQTRKLAGIDFPGMTSHDAVARMAFGVVPPDDWLDPVTGALDIPGWGRVPPAPFYRAEHGVFACRRMGDRAMLITLELARSAQEDRLDDDDEDDTPVSLAEIEASVKTCTRSRRSAATGLAGRAIRPAPLLRHQLEDRVGVQIGSGLPGRRRGACPLSAGRAGPEPWPAGRGEPRLEAGRSHCRWC